MTINSLLILLPIICWPLATVLLTRFSREKWSLQTVIYRQIWITVLWSPILFLLSSSDLEILKLHLDSVFLTSLFWSLYIFMVFLWFDYLPVWISRLFTIISRILLSLFLWYFFLSEYIWFNDFIWLIILFLGLIVLSFDKINNLHLKRNNILYGIIISILNWLLFWLSLYYFKIYSEWVNPIVSWYIMESLDVFLLFIFAIVFSFYHKRNYFTAPKKEFLKIFFIAPIALIWSIWLAFSYDYISFYVINSLFVLIFFVSLFLSYLILWEKVTKKQIISMMIIMISLYIIVVF